MKRWFCIKFESRVNRCRVVLQLLAVIVWTLSASTLLAISNDPLNVREIPRALTTWDAIRSHVLQGADAGALAQAGIALEEGSNSLSLKRGDDLYQLVLHNGDVIQYSTVTLRELGVSGVTQFGRSQARSIASYLRQHSTLMNIMHFLRASGIAVREQSRSQLSEDFRSALIYPDDGSAPYISLSDRFAKHPIFGFAHEAQHFLNQPMLSVSVEKIFGTAALFSEEASSLKSFLDEYLAVKAEIDTFRVLGTKFPHLTGQEILELSRYSDEDLKKHIYNKWSSYYQWPKKVLVMYLEARVDGAKLLQEVRDFSLRYGLKQDVAAKSRALLDFEQKQNPKLVDETVIASPKNAHLPWAYRPEAGLTFPLRTVWIPESDLNVAGNYEASPTTLRRELTRTNQNGVKEFAFFIHPMSEKKFEDLIARYQSSYDFVATPSSSNRTLLLRSTKSGRQIYVKTSLASVVAGIERLVPAAEVSRSVEDSTFLSEIAQRDSRVLFLPEPLAIIPKGMERGGQVVRLAEANKPTGQLVPLFSFYSLENGKDLTGDLANARRISRSEFLRNEIVTPLLNLLHDMRDRHHFVHEAHAQNILVEMVNGFPSERFVLKDLAGITIDLSKYPQLVERLPRFRSIEKEYYQAERPVAFQQAFDVFLKSGFLYGVDQYLKRTEPRYRSEPSVIEMLNAPRTRPASSCQQVFGP